MDVVHVAHGATHPLFTPGSKDVRFVPLLDCFFYFHFGCAQVQPENWMRGPAIGNAGTIFVVRGRIAVTLQAFHVLIHLYAGTGGVFAPGDTCVMRAEAACTVDEMPKTIPAVGDLSTPGPNRCSLLPFRHGGVACSARTVLNVIRRKVDSADFGLIWHSAAANHFLCSIDQSIVRK